MKAIVLKEFGDPENLSLDDLPIPSVEPGAVLIRAVAASANPVDVSISKGTPFSPVLPAALGCDVAGVVESVGDGVTGFAPGDEVFGCVGGVRGSGGTLAEYVLADAKLLARKPRMLSMREAAALPLVAITAHEGIDRAGGFIGASCLGPRWDRRRRSCRRTNRRGTRREGLHHRIREIARNGHAHWRHGGQSTTDRKLWKPTWSVLPEAQASMLYSTH
jgi:D-arabinose 1-dehydrogenase-like Zn-dependent alcohol dehydrogenase